MSKHTRYFHRSFLAKPNEEGPAEAITARVSGTNKDWPHLSGMLVLDDGYDKILLSFFGEENKEIDSAITRAKKLHEVVMKFTEELEMAAEELKNQLKE